MGGDETHPLCHCIYPDCTDKEVRWEVHKAKRGKESGHEAGEKRGCWWGLCGTAAYKAGGE